MSDKQDTDKQDKGQPADTIGRAKQRERAFPRGAFCATGQQAEIRPAGPGDEPAAGGEPPSPPGPPGDAARDAPERDVPQPAIKRKERLDEFRRRQRRNRELLDDDACSGRT